MSEKYIPPGWRKGKWTGKWQMGISISSVIYYSFKCKVAEHTLYSSVKFPETDIVHDLKKSFIIPNSKFDISKIQPCWTSFSAVQKIHGSLKYLFQGFYNGYQNHCFNQLLPFRKEKVYTKFWLSTVYKMNYKYSKTAYVAFPDLTPAFSPTIPS